METGPQQKKRGVGILTALAGMLITFLAGVYVGLHPAWIPIRTGATPQDFSSPMILPAGATTEPATQPAEARPNSPLSNQPATPGQ